MKKIIKTVTLLALSGAMFYLGGLNKEQRMVIKVIEEDRPLLKEAFVYHGLKDAKINSEGIIYFVRDGKWCYLYNNSFRNMVAEKYQASDKSCLLEK